MINKILEHKLLTIAVIAMIINFYKFGWHVHRSKLHNDFLVLAVLTKLALSTCIAFLCTAWYNIVFLGFKPVPQMVNFIFSIASIFSIGSFVHYKYVNKKQ